MKFISLESERLVYRKFNMDDFLVVNDWLSDPDIMMYRRGEPRSEAEVRDYLDWAITNAEADPCSNFEYAITLKENGNLIGAATFMNVPDYPEIGWTIHRDYWRQGYGTEMGIAMLRLGFETLRIHRIIAGCNAENQASYKIMERLGMRREGHFIKAQLGNSALNNKWCERYLYAILREEWQEIHNQKGTSN
ncbi:MAG: GNAT family N-acetyltransferase [Defluviitaleaceae bacterium]|nr:GNAT family N-acetyltransferase [Defluviitaleaceae bacterium]